MIQRDNKYDDQQQQYQREEDRKESEDWKRIKDGYEQEQSEKKFD